MHQSFRGVAPDLAVLTFVTSTVKIKQRFVHRIYRREDNMNVWVCRARRAGSTLCDFSGRHTISGLAHKTMHKGTDTYINTQGLSLNKHILFLI